MSKARFLVVFMLLLTTVGSVRAQHYLPYDSDVLLEQRLYARRIKYTPDSLMLLRESRDQMPERIASMETRLDINARTTNTRILLQPRFFVDYAYTGEGESTECKGVFVQAYGSIRIGSNITLRAGRERLTWGMADYRSPSNPIFSSAGRSDPLREVPGVDAVSTRFTYSNLSATVAYVIGPGALEDAPDELRTELLHLEYRAYSGLGGVVIAREVFNSPFYGGYLQVFLSEGLLMYGEYGYGSRAVQLKPKLDSYSGQFSHVAPSRKKGTGLAGTSYTFLSGHVFSIEYYYNGFGYGKRDMEAYFRLFEHEDSIKLFRHTLSHAPDPLGREQLSVAIQSNPMSQFGYWRGYGIISLVDNSARFGLYYAAFILDRYELFLNGMYTLGERTGEHSSIVQLKGMIGIKIFLL